MYRNSLPLLVVVSTLLAGCAATPPPSDVELGFEIPSRWSVADDSISIDQEGSKAAADDDPWWSQLGDQDLPAIIGQALEHNHDLAAAAARVEAAAARARIAGADLRPQVSSSFDSSRRRQNFIGLPFPSTPSDPSDPTAPSGGGDSGVLSSTSTSHGVSLNLSWEADLWGRLRSAKRAAGKDLEAARIDLEGARLSLAGQTAKAWFAAAEAAEQQRLAQATLDNRQRTAERVDRRYRAGLRSALDLRLARSNEAFARAALEARDLQLDASRRQLETLVGHYPAAEIETADQITSAELPAVPAGVPAQLLARRPDLAALERRLTASGLRVAEARAGLYPRLSLTTSGGRSSDSLSDLVDNDFSVWSLAANLLQPLYAGGRLRAAVDLAEAGFSEMTSTLASRLLRAFSEVEAALASEHSFATQADALGAATRHARAARELAEGRYNSGLIDFLTVLESQRQALEAESRWIEARGRRLSSRIDLHLALGGGFHASPQDGIPIESAESTETAKPESPEETSLPSTATEAHTP